MGNLANTEARIKRLENLLKDETGTGGTGQNGTVLYPVRQLTLTEETSHDDAGNAAVTVLVSWKSPAGSLVPDKIKVMLNGVTAELAGGVTEYRKGGFAAGDTVKVIVTAVYSTGSSSAVTAQLIITGSGAAPDVPSGFSAVGGFCTITLRWGVPAGQNHSHMEIWESTRNDNLETAERIAQAYGTDFVRANCGVMETRWYWIRSVDTGGNKSEFAGPLSATTTAIEAEEIKEGAIAESKLAPSLAGKINDSEAAVQIIEEVRTGEVNVFQQPTAPTDGMSAGDLWIDSNEVVWRYIGGQWSKQENATAYSLLKAAISQYMVKTQVAADGKLKVAGFGVFNDATTGSEFCVLADRFFVYGEAPGGGHTTVQVFSIDTTQNPPVVGINGSLIVNGTIDGSKLNVASRIQLGEGGALIMGDGSVLQMGSGAIVINSETGVLQIKDPNNLTTGDYIRMDVGDLTTYKYIAGAYRAMKSLRRMEIGVAANGVTVTLPGYWPSLPKIMVSPNALQSYNAGYSSQSQQLRIYPDAAVINNGVVTFVPRAYLEIAAGGNNVQQPVPLKNVVLGRQTSSQVYVTLPASVVTDTYSSVPYGAKNIVVTVKAYAQFCYGYTMSGGGDFDYSYSPVRITLTAYIGGTALSLGSYTFPARADYIPSEPSSQYVAFSATLGSGSGNVYIYAYVEYLAGQIGFGDVENLYRSRLWLKFDSIQWSLSGSTQLASGTLNYVAIAE